MGSSIPPPVLILPSAYPQLVRPLCGSNPVTDLTISWIMSFACLLIVLLSHKKIQEHLSKCWHFPPAKLNIRSLYIYIQIQTLISVCTLRLFRPCFSLFSRSFWIWTKCCTTTINCRVSVKHWSQQLKKRKKKVNVTASLLHCASSYASYASKTTAICNTAFDFAS